ncbi:hypothetical protein Hanom_Chr10g00916371 [Helianthus anomalus]
MSIVAPTLYSSCRPDFLFLLNPQDAPIFASPPPPVWLQDGITNLQLQARISFGLVTEKAKVEFLEAATRIEDSLNNQRRWRCWLCRLRQW